MESNWRTNIALMGMSGPMLAAPGVGYPLRYLAKLNPALPVGIGVWKWVALWDYPVTPFYVLCTEPVPGYAEFSFNAGHLGGAHFPGPFTVDPD